MEQQGSNLFWAFTSWIASIISPIALLSSAETPIWMFLVASVLVPLSVGFGGKFLDMWWQARTAKKAEKKRKDGK